MQVASYRGPGMGGGVSPALSRLMANRSSNHIWWWHIDSDRVRCAIDRQENVADLKSISRGIIDGHYRYCNQFLWPIMHDLSQYATYNPEDRALYERFNRVYSREIHLNGAREKIFVQDYQLALTPQELSRHEGPACGVFWHIPWPESVPDKYLPPVIDLAKALLSAEFVGFHTKEYGDNFINFVCTHVQRTLCLQNQVLVMRRHPLQMTRVITAPLGLDVVHWQELARRPIARLHPTWNHLKSLLNSNFVLSIDRADYTKGVLNRLNGIDQFFEDHPHMKGQVTFAQLCTRTRPGIASFDDYWFACQQKLQAVNEKFRLGNWQPIVSIPGPLATDELSLLYKNAKVMLVTPVRDGLNLTAKEFVACQTDNPGVLVLSPHAGVWSEVGRFSVKADPFDKYSMSRAIHTALTMPSSVRRGFHMQMLERLEENTISHWCELFAELLEAQESGVEELASV